MGLNWISVFQVIDKFLSSPVVSVFISPTIIVCSRHNSFIHIFVWEKTVRLIVVGELRVVQCVIYQMIRLVLYTVAIQMSCHNVCVYVAIVTHYKVGVVLP